MAAADAKNIAKRSASYAHAEPSVIVSPMRAPRYKLASYMAVTHLPRSACFLLQARHAVFSSDFPDYDRFHLPNQ
jgi:hypothetical protein